MTPGDLFKAGRLQDALDAQLLDVKANPGDPNRRLFLFELAAFTGDLDRARRQIDLLKFDVPQLQQAVQMYRGCLDAEQVRRDVFAAKQLPAVLGEAPDHIARRLQAIANPAEAAALLAEANAASNSGKLSIDGKVYDAVRDADDLLGSVLEVFGQGRYLWIPLEQVESLQSHPPRFPRDLLWMPARLVTRGGPAGDVFLPMLYPNSHAHADDAIKLGRATDWLEPAPELIRGAGAKVFLAGNDNVALLDIRELTSA